MEQNRKFVLTTMLPNCECFHDALKLARILLPDISSARIDLLLTADGQERYWIGTEVAHNVQGSIPAEQLNKAGRGFWYVCEWDGLFSDPTSDNVEVARHAVQNNRALDIPGSLACRIKEEYYRQEFSKV